MAIATANRLATDETFHVKVRRPNRHAPQAIGTMDAGTLVQRYAIPHRNSRTKQGYQRPASPGRVNKLVADLKKGRVDLPTAVLLNLRDFDIDVNLVELGDGGAEFRPEGQMLYVVDGQHRIEALAKLVDDDPDRWSTYVIPFVCMLGADEREEMEQFYVVNSTAKSVRTDLALDLLKRRAENDPALMEALVEKGEDWKVDAQTIAEELRGSRLWKGRIRFPSEPKGETTIGSAGLVSSLKQVLATPYFTAIKTPNRVRILEAYWEGVARVIPEAFREPSDYAIQKSTGVMIMHSLLIPVLELLRSRGMSVVEAESYEEVLRDTLTNLEGDTAEGDVARGADFWLSGAHGAAGSFSSNAGRRVLSVRLKNELPELEVE